MALVKYAAVHWLQQCFAVSAILWCNSLPLCTAQLFWQIIPFMVIVYVWNMVQLIENSMQILWGPVHGQFTCNTNLSGDLHPDTQHQADPHWSCCYGNICGQKSKEVYLLPVGAFERLLNCFSPSLFLSPCPFSLLSSKGRAVIKSGSEEDCLRCKELINVNYVPFHSLW